MKTSDFNFDLPAELLAEHPSEHRDEARLMVLDRKTETIEHKLFKDVVDYFDEDDLFIFNNTKVFLHVFMETKRKQVLKLKFSF